MALTEGNVLHSNFFTQYCSLGITSPSPVWEVEYGFVIVKTMMIAMIVWRHEAWIFGGMHGTGISMSALVSQVWVQKTVRKYFLFLFSIFAMWTVLKAAFKPNQVSQWLAAGPCSFVGSVTFIKWPICGGVVDEESQSGHLSDWLFVFGKLVCVGLKDLWTYFWYHDCSILQRTHMDAHKESKCFPL